MSSGDKCEKMYQKNWSHKLTGRIDNYNGLLLDCIYLFSPAIGVNIKERKYKKGDI